MLLPMALLGCAFTSGAGFGDLTEMTVRAALTPGASPKRARSICRNGCSGSAPK